MELEPLSEELTPEFVTPIKICPEASVELNTDGETSLLEELKPPETTMVTELTQWEPSLELTESVLLQEPNGLPARD
jgi:hypothetical protein